MTCPVSAMPDAPRPTGDIADLFDDVAGSVFVGLFAAGLFDQAMLPSVSMALEATGRIRNAPWGRAVRTAASDQIVFCGDDDDRRAEMERLRRLHRDVKGIDAQGVRYSALNPESWNWILVSTFFVYRNAFFAVSGHQPTAAANQAVWDRFCERVDGLQLSGRSRLPQDYEELCAYYNGVVAEKLEATDTLGHAVRFASRPARPDVLPAITAPLWNVASPAVGHVLLVLGFGIMHPDVRALVPMRWTRRHDREFAALSAAIRIAYRWLPTQLTDTPLARNRRQYRRLMARYQRIGLASFAPE